jgi:hypothetical protein
VGRWVGEVTQNKKLPEVVIFFQKWLRSHSLLRGRSKHKRGRLHSRE